MQYFGWKCILRMITLYCVLWKKALAVLSFIELIGMRSGDWHESEIMLTDVASLIRQGSFYAGYYTMG